MAEKLLGEKDENHCLKAGKALHRISQCALILDHAYRVAIERMITCKKEVIGLHEYIDINEYDETPLSMTFDENEDTTSSASTAVVLRAGSSTAIIQRQPGVLHGAKTLKSVNKLLQSYHGYGMLVSVGDKFVGLTGSSLSSLFALESNDASCTREAQARLSGVSIHAAEF